MDAKLLESLGATVTTVAVEYNRKVGDGNFGSVGASMTAEANLVAGADPDVAANGMYEWCRAVVARNLKPEAVAAREHPATVVAAPVAPPPPVAQPVQRPELSIVTLDAPTCAHVFDQGEDRFKVFGGAWKRFGVSVYPEVLAEYPQLAGWEAWPVCKIGKQGAEAENRYALPGGFQKVEVEVNAEGKPQRVHSFK